MQTDHSVSTVTAYKAYDQRWDFNTVRKCHCFMATNYKINIENSTCVFTM